MQDSGHQDAKKSAGGKDKAQSRRNPHIHVELPDTRKDQDREAQVHAALVERMVNADPRAEGHGKRYGADVMAVVIALRRDGKTWGQIAKMGRIGNVRLPSDRGLRYLRNGNPEFEEACRRARKDSELDSVEYGVQSIDLMGDKARKLRGMPSVVALNMHAGRALSLGRAALPDSYGGEVQDREVIVMEVSGGWDPGAATAGPSESDGQGSEAEAARLRWQAIREHGEDSDISRTAYADMDPGGSEETSASTGKTRKAGRKTGKASGKLRTADGLHRRTGKRKAKGAGEAPA